jgi:hypothetical protein
MKRFIVVRRYNSGPGSDYMYDQVFTDVGEAFSWAGRRQAERPGTYYVARLEGVVVADTPAAADQG